MVTYYITWEELGVLLFISALSGAGLTYGVWKIIEVLIKRNIL